MILSFGRDPSNHGKRVFGLFSAPIIYPVVVHIYVLEWKLKTVLKRMVGKKKFNILSIWQNFEVRTTKQLESWFFYFQGWPVLFVFSFNDDKSVSAIDRGEKKKVATKESAPK